MKPLYHEDRIVVYVLMTALIGSLVLAFFRSSWSLGFLFGSLIAAVGIRLLTVDVRRLTMTRSPIKAAAIGYMKRYIIYGGSMAVALTNPQISFPAVVLGLLVPKALILILTLFVRRTSFGS